MKKKIVRIIFPEEFTQQQKLLALVIAKDTLLGAGSPIRAYLTEKAIVLVDDGTASTSAGTFEDTAVQLNKDAEKKTEKRNLLFDPVFENLNTIIQFLKRFYRKETHKLGDWGVTLNANRVALPVTFDDRVTLFRAVKTKHDSYVTPAVSPIAAFMTENDIDIDQDETDTDSAETNNNDSKQFMRDAETARGDRDNAFGDVPEHLRGIGQFLVGFYVNNPKKAGDFGYIVDDSPRPPKLRKTVLKPSELKVLKGVVVGGTLTNIGTVSIKVWKGTDTNVEPIVVSAGNKIGTTEGFSTITVSNPSDTEKAIFTTLSSK